MSEHSRYEDLLPLYAAGTLEAGQRREVEIHLAGCPACREELSLWQAMANQVVEADAALIAPPDLAGRALQRIHARRPSIVRRALQLLQAQIPLVRRELWPATAAVVALGYVVALIANRAVVIQALAPLVAAASLALLYGPENDPGFELASATPTSPWQILLARLVLVFGYDLALASAASLGLLLIVPWTALGPLILGWLAPMAFLSTAALALSLWLGTGNAVAVTYLAWLVNLVAAGLAQNPSVVNVGLGVALARYQEFWSSPLLLLALSAGLAGLALWRVGRRERTLPRWA